MATPSIPDLLQKLAENSTAQLQLLKDQGQAGKQFQSQLGSAHLQNLLGSILPGGLAQPVSHVARTGFHAMNSLSQARQAVKTAGSAISNASSAGEVLASLGPLASAAALTAGAMVAVTAAAVAVPFAIYGWTQSLLESQRQIARFSPELASIFLTMDAAQMARDRTMGRETAGSTGELAESMMAIQDALLPIRIAITNIENKVGGSMLDYLTNLVEGLADLLGIAGDLQDDVTGPAAFKAEADRLAAQHLTRRRIAEGRGQQPFAGRP